MKNNGMLTVRIPNKHKQRLKEIAYNYNCTVSDIVNIAIRRYLKNETRRERIQRERQHHLYYEADNQV